MLERVTSMIEKARYSKFNLWLLNFLFLKAIPFNKPHRLRITEIGEDYIATFAPYRRKNFNHIKGIHACCIATIGEYAAGLMFLRSLNPKDYRFILAKLEIEYTYQAKKNLTAICTLSKENLEKNIIDVLKQQDSLVYQQKTEIFDTDKKLVAICKTDWQIKPWSKVKTRV